MSQPVRIPADVDMDDRVLGPLTARQLAILATAGAVLYLLWMAIRTVVPIPVFLAFAVPVAAVSAMVALGKRDGMPMDKLLVAAIRQRLTARHRVAAPEGVRPAPVWLTADIDRASRESTQSRDWKRRGDRSDEVSPSALRLPAEAVTETGVIDLGEDGLAVVAVASTVNFALRIANEQQALVSSFGRYLHSLTAPVQVLVRTERLDLSAQIAELRELAGGLPHPALEAAALEHADYLAQLGNQSQLLRRQVLLVLREPLGLVAPSVGADGPLAALTAVGTRRRRAGSQVNAGERRAAESRLVRRLGEAIDLLSPAGIVVTPLDAGQATAVLASACSPDNLLPVSAELAGADDVITTTATDFSGDFDSESHYAQDPSFHRATPSSTEDDWDYEDDDHHDSEGRWSR
ncbi:PrgI family protein [Lentzea sp. HUAS12]|uniref:PrgI family protein n=1 Tax=Lentzea sp. HUAS12 TaxID=2951806 RepID=UPI0020A0A736|nr:PrgI family protein [Lentzea sp. HUAS12]USX56410.1 PrgI family protein [Lentzea sp. HUAS12]